MSTASFWLRNPMNKDLEVVVSSARPHLAQSFFADKIGLAPPALADVVGACRQSQSAFALRKTHAKRIRCLRRKCMMERNVNGCIRALVGAALVCRNKHLR